MTNLIYSQNINAVTCFLKDSFSKLLWRLCGMFGAFRYCTQVERLSSQKNVQAWQRYINILAWKHQNFSLLLSNGFSLELKKFYQKSQLSFHLQGSCLQLMLKYWPAFWPLFINIINLNIASLRLSSNPPNQALTCNLVFKMMKTISFSINQACYQKAVKGDDQSHSSHLNFVLFILSFYLSLNWIPHQEVLIFYVDDCSLPPLGSVNADAFRTMPLRPPLWNNEWDPPLLLFSLPPPTLCACTRFLQSLLLLPLLWN